MQKSTKWFLGILAALIFFAAAIVGIVSVALFSGGGDVTEEKVTGKGDKIAVIEIYGAIYSSEEPVRQLKKYAEDGSIKAILLHINSPGGGVAASQEIYEEVKRTDKEKPVIVSMSSLAASGGYYVSCGARKIVANPGTLTGSIGVISQFFDVSKLMDKIGVTSNTIKSGKMKDEGNPFREMTEEEKKNFQQLSDNIHSQFIAAVEKARKLPHERVVELADGRVYSGDQALKFGLIDTLGTFEDAVRITADEAGISGEPALVKEVERASLVERLFGTSLQKNISSLKTEIFDQPVLQYRMPGSW